MARIVFHIIAASLALIATVTADDQKEPKDAKNDSKESAEADEVFRREALKLVDGIEVEIWNDEKWSKVKRIEKPVLFYGDPTRNNDRGSVWAWGEKGRPAVLLELYQNISDRRKWVYCMCNTSGGKLRASRNGDPWWRENTSAAELKDVPDAPVPGKDAAPRLRQIKQLAQKFTGHQFWDPNNSRYELRRLEKPLHTYKDEEAGLLDGALYTLANGTNPEILIFLEAKVDPNDKTKTAWQFTTGRLAHAELHMEYDGKEIFTAPRGNDLSGRDKPYWLGFITSAAEEKPK
jgi:hypothetical protein